MSVQGMWTRQFTPDGTPFYFNATLNKSLWKPPPNAVVLESEKLKERVERDLNSNNKNDASASTSDKDSDAAVASDPTGS